MSTHELDAMLAALKPPKRRRPLVAIIGVNEGTEVTDYLMPYGILSRANVADVPTIRYVPNQRLVVDQGVVTTTGISASMPMSLMLIEAIAGRDRAQEVAEQIGLTQWDARHDSEAFRFTRSFALSVMGNALAFWKHERIRIHLRAGVDEVSLALVADMWSRTYRSRAVTCSASLDPQRTRGGLLIIPDEVLADSPSRKQLLKIEDAPPAAVLDQTLHAIAARYGARTADVVAMQLEYSREFRCS